VAVKGRRARSPTGKKKENTDRPRGSFGTGGHVEEVVSSLEAPAVLQQRSALKRVQKPPGSTFKVRRERPEGQRDNNLVEEAVLLEGTAWSERGQEKRNAKTLTNWTHMRKKRGERGGPREGSCWTSRRSRANESALNASVLGTSSNNKTVHGEKHKSRKGVTSQEQLL